MMQTLEWLGVVAAGVVIVVIVGCVAIVVVVGTVRSLRAGGTPLRETPGVPPDTIFNPNPPITPPEPERKPL